MYNYNELASSMEDLVMDFLLFRKTKKSPGVKAQAGFEAGKGWPSYESVQSPLIPEEKMPKNYGDYSGINSGINYSWRYSKRDEAEATAAKSKEKFSSLNYPVDYKQDYMYPKPEHLEFFYGEIQKDMERMQTLHGDINAKLQPFVDEILNEYEYTGSPVSGDRVSHDTLNQIVDKVIVLASNQSPEVKEIFDELERSGWCRKRLMRSCVESLVLCDLFGRRRPMYRCIFGSAYEYFK